MSVFVSLIVVASDSLSRGASESETPKSTTMHVPYASSTCNEHNWSAANAAFTLIPIITTYVLQPKGSHAFLEGKRLWRFSPLFALFETIWIWLWILDGWISNRSLRATCAALLATRITMSRSYVDFNGFPRHRKPFSQRIKELSETRTYDGHNVFGDWLFYFVMKAMGLQDDHATEDGSSAQADHHGADFGFLRAEDSIESFFREDLSEATHAEKDIMLRAVIWALIFLQVFKLVIVTGGYFIRIVGFLYALSVLSVELISVYVTFPSPPSEFEEHQAKHIWSRCVVSHASMWVSGSVLWRSGGNTVNASLILFSVTMGSAAFIHAFFTNFISIMGTFALIAPASSLNDKASSYGKYPEALAIALFTMLVFLPLCWVLCSLMLVPNWVLWISKHTIKVWNRVVPDGLRVTQCWNHEEKSRETAHLLSIPNWLATWHFASIIFALLGFDYLPFWDVRFRCWETKKPAYYYDWLG